MKTLKKMTGPVFKQRMIVKCFKTEDDRNKFQNAQYDNSWSECADDMKAGTYAFCGGQWHNVKKLDS